VAEAPNAVEPLAAYAEEVAAAVGGRGAAQAGTAKVVVPAAGWVEALTTARDQFGLIFFSFLSAIDWANDVATGDPLEEETEERYEILCTLADLSEGRRVTFAADISKDNPHIESVVELFPGAGWHEREAHEMFGITFDGNSDLANLYLPDGFVGHPLRKSYPLMSREVKPWPGKVDVEGIPEPPEDGPSTTNPEA
jgi:NADH-quinone oxidoreductase subunit C